MMPLKGKIERQSTARSLPRHDFEREVPNDRTVDSEEHGDAYGHTNQGN